MELMELMICLLVPLVPLSFLITRELRRSSRRAYLRTRGWMVVVGYVPKHVPKTTKTKKIINKTRA